MQGNGKGGVKITQTLAVKLGSIAVHADEMLSENRHRFDVAALRTLLDDKEVKEWLAAMDAKAFLPKKRLTND